MSVFVINLSYTEL